MYEGKGKMMLDTFQLALITLIGEVIYFVPVLQKRKTQAHTEVEERCSPTNHLLQVQETLFKQ